MQKAGLTAYGILRLHFSLLCYLCTLAPMLNLYAAGRSLTFVQCTLSA